MVNTKTSGQAPTLVRGQDQRTPLVAPATSRKGRVRRPEPHARSMIRTEHHALAPRPAGTPRFGVVSSACGIRISTTHSDGPGTHVLDRLRDPQGRRQVALSQRGSVLAARTAQVGTTTETPVETFQRVRSDAATHSPGFGAPPSSQLPLHHAPGIAPASDLHASVQELRQLLRISPSSRQRWYHVQHHAAGSSTG